VVKETILKNMRQWGWDDIPYVTWKINNSCSKHVQTTKQKKCLVERPIVHGWLKGAIHLDIASGNLAVQKKPATSGAQLIIQIFPMGTITL
jgi:hypothetical protein